MRLKTLRIRGFRSFREESEVSFPNQGLVLVRGVNESTGGSSGAGKTALTTSLAYALGYARTPATRLQCWEDGSPKLLAEVALASDDDANQVTICRGPGKVEVAVNGSPVTGQIEAQEAAAWKALGLSQTLVEVLGHRRQRTGSAFLEKSDADKKSFLAEILGLGRFEVAADAADEQAITLERDLLAAQATLTAARAVLGVNPAPTPQAHQEAQRALLQAVERRDQLRRQAEEFKGAEAHLRQTHADAKLARTAPYQAILDQRNQELAAVKADAAKPPVVPPEDLADLAKQQQILAEVQRREKEVRDQDQERYRAWGVTRRNVTEIWMARERDIQARRTLSDKLSTLTARRTAFAANTCPTCQRTWDQAQQQLVLLQAEIVSVEDELRAIDARMSTPVVSPTAWEQANPFVPDPVVGQFQNILAQQHRTVAAAEERVRQAIGRIKAQAGQAVAEASKAVAEASSALWLAGEPTAEEREQVTSLAKLREQLNADTLLATTELGRAEVTANQVATAAQAHQEAQARETAALKTRDSIDWNLAAAQDEAALIRAFLAYFFDEVLQEIALETNRILGGVANVRHCALSWRSEVLNKKGKVTRRAIVPVLRIGEQEVVGADLDGVSGGMASSIWLAVDLGVLLVLERRLGQRLGWLVLDEAFEGLDAPSKETCLQVLKEVAGDRMVLVIDHTAEIGGLFDAEIVVRHKDGHSWAESC